VAELHARGIRLRPASKGKIASPKIVNAHRYWPQSPRADAHRSIRGRSADTHEQRPGHKNEKAKQITSTGDRHYPDDREDKESQ